MGVGRGDGRAGEAELPPPTTKRVWLRVGEVVRTDDCGVMDGTGVRSQGGADGGGGILKGEALEGRFRVQQPREGCSGLLAVPGFSPLPQGLNLWGLLCLC